MDPLGNGRVESRKIGRANGALCSWFPGEGGTCRPGPGDNGGTTVARPLDGPGSRWQNLEPRLVTDNGSALDPDRTESPMTEVEGSVRNAQTAFRVGHYVFKKALTPAEIEQLHELNYRTFVQEIPQHEDTGEGALVDKFHRKNTYFMALDENRVVGMVAVHGEPPFSVEDKLNDPSVLEALGDRPLEVRLLAVEPGLRTGQVFIGLAYLVFAHACEHGYTHLLISGVEDQLSLYHHMGFQPIGPRVVNGGAHFIPMAVSLDDFPPSILRDAERYGRRTRGSGGNGTSRTGSSNGKRRVSEEPGVPTEISLLPGPVALMPAVRKALEQPAIYHRGEGFKEVFHGIRSTLQDLVGKPAALFNGSGTLANEVIAANLKADRSLGRGAVLVTGEFGRRLAHQASRHGLEFELLERPWGEPWPLADLETLLSRESDIGWVWGTHLETSTGRMNPIDRLLEVVEGTEVKVCLDCVSSLGAVPIDLGQVHLASGASGKSLASKAGVAIVFGRAEDLSSVDSRRVPQYLDLRATLETPGPRFTFGSQDLVALEAALRAYRTPELRELRFEMLQELGRFVRRGLRKSGFEPLAPESASAPIITTILPPGGLTSTEFVEVCRSWGYLVGGESGYLQDRGWAQIATMGNLTRETCEGFLDQLRRWMGTEAFTS